MSPIDVLESWLRCSLFLSSSLLCAHIVVDVVLVVVSFIVAVLLPSAEGLMQSPVLSP